MGSYFDNQSKWSWNVSDGKAQLTTDHGTHTHTLDVSNVSVGEMNDNTGKVMGDAHRAASHDYKSAQDAYMQCAQEYQSSQKSTSIDTKSAQEAYQECAQEYMAENGINADTNNSSNEVEAVNQSEQTQVSASESETISSSESNDNSQEQSQGM